MTRNTYVHKERSGIGVIVKEGDMCNVEVRGNPYRGVEIRRGGVLYPREAEKLDLNS